MCGIIASFGTPIKEKNKKVKEPSKVNGQVMDQYQDQCNRGTRGFGIIRIDRKANVEIDRATQENKFLIDLYLKSSTMIIAHHRMPTSSDNKIKQTHPIFISDPMLEYDYYFVHNGVISNSDKLKVKHEEMGFKYSTEYLKEKVYAAGTDEIKYNDSESLGIETALYIEKKKKEIEVDNMAAFIALQINKKSRKAEKVFFGRNGHQDLKMAKVKGNLKISSEGEGEDVLENTLFSFEIKDPKMKLTSRDLIYKIEKPAPPEGVPSRYHNSHYQNIHSQNNLNLPITKTIGTEETDTDKVTVITLEERPWLTEAPDPTTEYDFDDETFIDHKSYKEETCDTFKKELESDNTDSIPTTLDGALDDQVERIEKIMKEFQKIVLSRPIDGKERSFYLSQTYHILRTMEMMCDLSSDMFKEKLEKEKLDEEESAYDDHTVGFQAPRPFRNGVHDRRTEDFDYMP